MRKRRKKKVNMKNAEDISIDINFLLHMLSQLEGQMLISNFPTVYDRKGSALLILLRTGTFIMTKTRQLTI